MCMGGSAKAPKIVQGQGPDTAGYSQQMQQFQQQQAAQAKAYQDQVNQQIAGINAETQRMQAQYESELAAQEAAKTAADANAYLTSSQEGEFTEDKLTTQKIKKDEKSESTLKIAQGGTKSKLGAGLNIGV